MSVPKIRANYDDLAQITRAFQQQAVATRQSLQQIKSQTEVLRGGDWVGQGAQAYFHEMDGQVLPALGRLLSALEEGGRVASMISKLMQAAEDEAARLLRGDGVAAGAVGAALGAAVGAAVGAVVAGLAGGAAGASAAAAAGAAVGGAAGSTATGDSISRDEWVWRKNYRVWDANRKVFLYPENFIEPGGDGGSGAGAGGGTPGVGDPTSRMTNQLDPQVGHTLSQSPTLSAQLAALEADGWTIVKGPERLNYFNGRLLEAGDLTREQEARRRPADGDSFADRATKTITVNDGVPPDVTAGGLAHEIGHFAPVMKTIDNDIAWGDQLFQRDTIASINESIEAPYRPPAGLTRDQYIDQNVQEQLRTGGEAQLNAASARDEIAQAGGPDTGIPGSQTAAYQAVHVEFKAGNITRAEAIEQMANLMGNETTSNTSENYRAYYGHTYEDFWDTNVAPAGGTP